MEFKRNVLTTFPKDHDIEYRVSIVSVGDSPDYVDLREYIPSGDFYGRGVTFPIKHLGQVMESLRLYTHPEEEWAVGVLSGSE